ncbi:hypothetical protein D3C87_2097320 [compost metagenome]
MWKQIKMLEHHTHLLTHGVYMLFKGLPFERLIDLHTVKPDFAAIQGLKMVDRAQKRTLS